MFICVSSSSFQFRTEDRRGMRKNKNPTKFGNFNGMWIELFPLFFRKLIPFYNFNCIVQLLWSNLFHFKSEKIQNQIEFIIIDATVSLCYLSLFFSIFAPWSDLKYWNIYAQNSKSVSHTFKKKTIHRREKISTKNRRSKRSFLKSKKKRSLVNTTRKKFMLIYKSK